MRARRTCPSDLDAFIAETILFARRCGGPDDISQRAASLGALRSNRWGRVPFGWRRRVHIALSVHAHRASYNTLDFISITVIENKSLDKKYR
ncbi:hypothetical protein B5X24_HaOG210463 [Helicoverpa armigera]|nr:hypothetical protein B5X24_HaOG210463 [Helicoverpa armigera]